MIQLLTKLWSQNSYSGLSNTNAFLLHSTFLPIFFKNDIKSILKRKWKHRRAVNPFCYQIYMIFSSFFSFRSKQFQPVIPAPFLHPLGASLIENNYCVYVPGTAGELTHCISTIMQYILTLVLCNRWGHEHRVVLK